MIECTYFTFNEVSPSKWNSVTSTSQYMKFSLKMFSANGIKSGVSSKIPSHLLKISWMENFIYCAVITWWRIFIDCLAFSQNIPSTFFDRISNTPVLFKYYRSSHRRCSLKNGVLKNFSNITGKHFQTYKVIKRRFQHRCFPVKCAKCLGTHILDTSANGCFCYCHV